MTTNLVSKQIVAMGGGGFSMESENPLLDLYILNYRKRQYLIFALCLLLVVILTNTSLNSTQPFSNYLVSHLIFRCLTHLPQILGLSCLSKDIIYVGGNTKSLIALWKEWGLDNILREAWENGVILSG
jgi:peptidase E